MTISASTFWKTVIVGLIATFVMSLAGFWQDWLGLIELDVGAMLAASMSGTHTEAPYGLVAGNLVHFVNGVLLALAYVVWVARRVGGNWFVQGAAYTVLTTLAAAIIVVPAAAGVGVFFTNTPAPILMTLSDLTAHAAYAFTLTYGLKVAGVVGAEVVIAPAQPTAFRRVA